VLVFDTSAFINGWRYHYPPSTFPSIWELFGYAMADGRIVAPRAVYLELDDKDDEVFKWAKGLKQHFCEPTEAVQRLAGAIEATLPKPGVRDQADPFVIAEAELRGFTVVTYEGTNTITGARTKRWHEKMPGVCHQRNIACCIVPQALGMLGGQF
jgi:hypothetical protein